MSNNEVTPTISPGVSRSGISPMPAARREEMLELAERSAGIGIWDMDMNTQLVTATSQFFRNLGIPVREEPVHIDEIRALRHPEDNAHVVASFQAAVQAGDDTFETEYRVIRPDGEIRWIFGRGRVIRGEGGIPIRYSGVDIDITERKRAEEALRQSEERYRTLVENASDLVFTLDLDLNVTSANPAAARFLGYSLDEIRGRPLQTFVPQEQIAMHRAMLRRKLSFETDETRYEMQVIDAHGRVRFLDTNSRLSFNRSGRPEAIHAIARDVTDRKKYEEHLALTTRELSHRTKNLLAVLQAIVAQIGKRASTFPEFEKRLSGCIFALAQSHDLLVDADWKGASLHELVLKQIALFGIDEERIEIQGEPVLLNPQSTQLLGLALHELTTNAIKYGALSADAGTVTIAWTREPDGSLQLSWSESGGPPVVSPTRRGCGTAMLKRMAATVEATSEIKFSPTGVQWTLMLPASSMVESS